MLNIMYFIGPILFAVAAIFTINTAVKRSAEIKKYKILIANTNDATVLEWLESFKKTRNFNTRSDAVKINGVGNSFLVDDKLRFVQVWEIVKDSATVSANVKEQVKKTLLLESIPIKP